MPSWSTKATRTCPPFPAATLAGPCSATPSSPPSGSPESRDTSASPSSALWARGPLSPSIWRMACLSCRQPVLERTNTPRTRRATTRMRKETSMMTPRQHPLPRDGQALPPVPPAARDAIARSRLQHPRLLALGLALASLIAPIPAAAHVNVDVGDGQYVMELGFRDEPAYLGLPNALFLKVGEYGTGGTEPVEELAGTLTAEVTKDGQTKQLPLVPMGDGVYEGALVPTAVGDYTFHVSGTIGDAPVDESVTSGPTTFNSVEPLSAIEFPFSQPDAGQLAAAGADAQAAAATARTLGMVGVAAGILGLIMAVVALTRAGRTPAKAEPPSTPASGKLIR